MNKQILGDFQTPSALADEIIATLRRQGVVWSRVLEPSCGRGNFIEAVLKSTRAADQIIGIELQTHYVEEARRRFAATPGVTILQQDILHTHSARDLPWLHQGPLLVVGNPPWITNSAQGRVNSANLPNKSNFKGLRGIEAITGKANFDIAEYIYLRLIADFADAQATVALLCKTSVARSVIEFARQTSLPISSASLYYIDAKRWFDAAVDACLFTVSIDGTRPSYEVRVFDALTTDVPRSIMGFAGNTLVANIEKYRAVAYLDNKEKRSNGWRAGIKHDAAAVMELKRRGEQWINGLGEPVSVEDGYVYPLVKGADLGLPAGQTPRRAVIVPQRRVGEDTTLLARAAPQLWAYLKQHESRFAERKSSIYKRNPIFSVFGVGEYSFANFKVMVSGFSKVPVFVPIGPVWDKPVLCDDTCYQLAFDEPLQAVVAAAALNHPLARAYFDSVTFHDSKRPITKTLLDRIDLETLISHMPVEDLIASAESILRANPGLSVFVPDANSDRTEDVGALDRASYPKTLPLF